MRNWASAAHPNQNELSGLQVVSWLETCVREVLVKKPEGPVLEVRRLMHNVRTTNLTSADAPPIAANIAHLPQDLAASLLRALFGMFTDPNMAASAKNNIGLIAPAAWGRVTEVVRNEIGLSYSRFAANADVHRRDAAHDFLRRVNGLTYLPADARALEIDERVRTLESAHFGMNNFYNEPAPARALAAYVPETGAIPESVRPSYVRVLTLARIGNPYGVSFEARPYYDQLIERFGEPEIQEFVKLVHDPDVSSRLQHRGSAQLFVRIAERLSEKTADPYTEEALAQILAATPQQLAGIGRTAAMRRTLKQMSRSARTT